MSGVELMGLELPRSYPTTHPFHQNQSDRTRRQYDAVDSANRLVAAELESRWNTAMVNVADAEARLAEETRSLQPLDEKQLERLKALGSDLRELWQDEAAPLDLKKRIIRTLIQEIVADVNHESGLIEMHIHWAGGVHTRLQVRKNKTGNNNYTASEDVVSLVTELAKGWADRNIAGMLNRIGCQTGAGNTWSENRVRSFRGTHGIPVYEEGSQRPWLTMEEAAAELGVNVAVLKALVKSGQLPARQIAKHMPWMILREDLKRPAVVASVALGRKRRQPPIDNDAQIVMPCI